MLTEETRTKPACFPLFLVLLSACGGEAAGGGGPPGSGGLAGQGADVPAGFHAQLVDNLNERPVPGMTVRALDNESGEALGMEAQSAAPSGEVVFTDLPDGQVAFVVIGKLNESIDTYQFNIDASAHDETLWIVAKSAAELAPGLANYTPDATKAVVAGGLYWVDAAGVEQPIGCATVRFEAQGGDIRYFGDNNLPTRDTPSPDDPSGEYRVDSNPLNGRYFIGNAPTGRQTVTLLVGGQELGSTSLVLFPGNIASDGESSVSISNIYAVGLSENPTPSGCQ